MSQADDLFAEAYRLNVVEEEHRKAIEICKKALALDANNYRIRVYLGMLLADYGTPEEKEEARQHFMDAIGSTKSNVELCDTWFEESGIHHLGIWEWNHDRFLNAYLLFLIDVFICHSKESQECLLEVRRLITPLQSSDVGSLLDKLAAPERF